MFIRAPLNDSTLPGLFTPASTTSAFFVPMMDGGIFPRIDDNRSEFAHLENDSSKARKSVKMPSSAVEFISIPRVSALKSVREGALASVIHIWEGTVVSVDVGAGVMDVRLDDRSGAVASHFAEISLEWVVDQDKELVEPGAIFYWTLYKEIKRGSISNAEEIRFRRLPNWTKVQLDNVTTEAANLAKKFSPAKRLAE
jgi:hypothetical protein